MLARTVSAGDKLTIKFMFTFGFPVSVALYGKVCGSETEYSLCPSLE